jgi:hypothetical protein
MSNAPPQPLQLCQLIGKRLNPVRRQIQLSQRNATRLFKHQQSILQSPATTKIINTRNRTSAED